MDRSVGAAARLPESDRRVLAIRALAGSETVSGLATRHGVSRKFIYQQTDKARAALDEAFMSAAPEDEALFELTVTNSWLRVSGTTKMPQIDHGVRHQFHTVMALLFELKAQQQPFEFILPCEGPLHA
jgi:hypothetical protein